MSEPHEAGVRPVTCTFTADDGGADDFVVTGFEGVEQLDRPFRFTIELSLADPELDLDALLGRGAVFTLERDGHVRFVHGVVERVTVDDREREVTVTAVLVPALVASRYTTNTRIFQELTAPLTRHLATALPAVRIDLLRASGSTRRSPGR